MDAVERIWEAARPEGARVDLVAGKYARAVAGGDLPNACHSEAAVTALLGDALCPDAAARLADWRSVAAMVERQGERFRIVAVCPPVADVLRVSIVGLPALVG